MLTSVSSRTGPTVLTRFGPTLEAPFDQHCPVTPDDDDDDLADAVVRPLMEDDPALAAKLAARFLAALQAADLSPAEREYLNGYKPLQISDGRTRGGLRVLQFRFGGSTTTIEWDGSHSDAEELVDGFAENAASNAAGDYWIAGRGWGEWNGTQGAPD